MRGVIATPPRPEPGLMAQLAKSLALGGGRRLDTEKMATAIGASSRVINAIKAPIDALWTGDPDTAGFEDANYIATTFLPFLRNGSLFYRALDSGMTRVPLEQRIGFTTATATAFVAAEGAAVAVSGMGLQGTTIKRLKANGLIVLTRDMLRTMGNAGEALIALELRRAISAAVDAQFIDIISDGITPTTSSGDAAADLRTLLTSVAPTNESRLMWGMSPDVAIAASTLVTASGAFLFPEMSPTGGRMLQVDAIVTNGLPVGTLALIDATGIAGASELITLEASDDTTIEMQTTPEGDSSVPTGSEMVSMFQTNSTAILSTSWFGALRFRDNAVAVMDGVTWGGATGD